jgi:hypothetical protein
VPHTCRSVKSRGDLAVGSIQSPGVVLLDHPRRGVAEPEGDQDRVRSRLQRHRRARVPQLSEPEPLESRSLERRIPDPVVERLPSDRSTLRRGEDQAVGRIPPQVFRDLERHELGDRHRAAGAFGLRRPRDEVAGVPAIEGGTAFESLLAPDGVSPVEEFAARERPNFLAEALEQGQRQQAAEQERVKRRKGETR